MMHVLLGQTLEQTLQALLDYILGLDARGLGWLRLRRRFGWRRGLGLGLLLALEWLAADARVGFV